MKLTAEYLRSIINEILGEEITWDGAKVTPQGEKWLKDKIGKYPKITKFLGVDGSGKTNQSAKAAAPKPDKIEQAIDNAKKDPEKLTQIATQPAVEKEFKKDAVVSKQTTQALKQTKAPPNLTKAQQKLSNLEQAKLQAQQNLNAWFKKNGKEKMGTPEHKKFVAALRKATDDLKKYKLEMSPEYSSAKAVATKISNDMTAWKRENPELAKKLGMDPTKPGYG
jgi:hypothetical protein